MAKIAFMDLEYYGNTPNGDIDNVFKVGIVISSGANKQGSTKEFKFEKEEDRDQKICEILKSNNIDCVCGHNIVDFDRTKLDEKIFENRKVIDTLFLSMLLEPTYLDHKLEKPYRKTDEINYESNSLSRYLINLKDNRTETIINDPILDAEESKNLFEKLDKKFDGLSERLKNTFAYLLSDDKHFQGYFNYKGIKKPNSINIYRNLKDEIVNTENGNKKKFLGAICDEVKFNELSRQNPTAFAFALAFIFFNDNYSAISSIILKKYPNVMRILKEIRFDLQKIDALELSKDIFEGIDEFKEFETIDGSSKISQKQIVDSALRDESFIAVLPTGAGKTYTFQLPALIKASIYKPLTIVISPLQALMKDQVENFAQKKGSKKFKIYASSGYLSYYEKQVVLKGVRDGSVDILYIAPESLRSEMVFNAISKRYIDRFVIDEAHCISTWGHDFRHDYFYIAKAIKELKGRDYQDKIAVSCFTATAKREVIDEIKEYFKKELDLDLKEFIASPKRKNLKYEAIKINNDDEKDTEKFKCLVNEIKELMKRNGGKIVPTIIYLPSSAEGCRDLSEKLSEKFLKLKIEPFYAKLDEEEGEGKKNEILTEFKEGKIDIVVATTAFGMGIDKGDIGAVIHYMLSDSLESYMQESGRGARDEKKMKEADCIILYDAKDFEYSKDMLLRNQITIQNISNVLKKLRELLEDKKDTAEIKLRDLIEAAEFDERGTKKSSFEIKQNKINTVLAELEKAGFISRLRDVYHITQPDETKYKIDEINGLTNDEKEKAKRIIAYIREKSSIDMQELLDVFGIDGSEDSSDNQKNSIKGFDKLLDKLEQEGILSKGHNDISAYIEKKGAISKLEELIKEENKILEKLTKKEFNQKKELKSKKELELSDEEIEIVKTWEDLVKLYEKDLKDTHIKILFDKKAKFPSVYYSEDKKIGGGKFKDCLEKRQEIFKYIINFVVDIKTLRDKDEGDVIIFTGVLKKELKDEFNLVKEINEKGVLDDKFFAHYITLLDKILGDKFVIKKSRLIYYKALKIKLEKMGNYTEKDYEQLRKYYSDKAWSLSYYQQYVETLAIAIDKSKAQKMSDDYFLSKPYVELKQEFPQVSLDELDEEQKKVCENDAQVLIVEAGPGSGKTTTLAYKTAILCLEKGYLQNEILMLTHQNAAVGAFHKKLYEIMSFNSIEVSTFHAYARKILKFTNSGPKQDYKKQIQEATKILEGEEDEYKSKDFTILPKVLILDEFQDVSESLLKFIKAIYKKMREKDEKSKMIVVGDNCQCINDFKYEDDTADIKNFNKLRDFIKNEIRLISEELSLYKNHRSITPIVNLANAFRSKVIGKEGCLKISDKNKDTTGSLCLIQCQSYNYIEDLKAKLKNDTSERIAILVHSNKIAATIYSALIAEGFSQNKVILNRSNNFSVRHLDEIRYFIDQLRSGVEFDKAKEATEKEYKKHTDEEINRELPESANFNLMLKIIDKFEKEFKGKLDFEEYIKIVDFNDFKDTNDKQTILVTTMHKSKGLTFDSIYVIAAFNYIDDREVSFKKFEEYLSNEYVKNKPKLEEFKNKIDYLKRTLYVAITRAKMHLCIYDEAENLNDEEMKKCFEESDTYQLSTEQNDSFIDKISITMDYWDVLSSNFKDMDFYSNIEKTKPRAGEYAKKIELRTNEGYRMSIEDKDISGLTSDGREIIEKFSKDYSVASAKILYVIRDDEREVDDPKNVYRIIWQITLEKKTD